MWIPGCDYYTGVDLEKTVEKSFGMALAHQVAAPSPTKKVRSMTSLESEHPLLESQLHSGLTPLSGTDKVLRVIAGSAVIIAMLLLLTVVYFARAILLPLALAVLLNLVFKPLVVKAERYHIPPSISAVAILLLAFVGLIVGIAALWSPATGWVSDLPNLKIQLTEKLRPIREPVDKISDATEEVEKIATAEDEGESPIRVRVEQPGLTSFFVNTSGSILAAMFLTLCLLYFLLAGGDDYLRRIVSIMPTFEDKKHAVQLTRSIQEAISRYLLTITCINVALGITIGSGMWALGLPTPVLWGGMACLLNYIPFIGAAVGASIVFVVALLQFDLGYATLAPLIYVLINIVEANFVTPILLGRSISLNPIVIVISLTMWGWMWGIGGAFLAVPLLVVFKITCEHIEPLAPFCTLLED